MIDIRKIDDAVTAALKHSGIEGGSYAVVIWNEDRRMAYVTSNVHDTGKVRAMFAGAIDVISCCPDGSSVDDLPTVGNA